MVPTLLSFGAASRCLISIPIHRDGFLEIGINVHCVTAALCQVSVTLWFHILYFNTTVEKFAKFIIGVCYDEIVERHQSGIGIVEVYCGKPGCSCNKALDNILCECVV